MTSATRPRAVVIVNPSAGRLSEKMRSDVLEALRSEFEFESYTTRARDIGIGLAAQAAADGVEIVIAFGGDGHVNEVANGLAGTESSLGIIPGGTMNVFARALGIPLDPLEAVRHLGAAMGRAPRQVPLGQMDDRYFTFSAGCGFDAEAAEIVEAHLSSKRRFGETFFYWSALRVLATSYRHRRASMRLKGDFGEIDVAMAIVSNAGPYAYLFGRGVDLAPEVDLDRGIDVFGLTTMRVEALPFYAWRVVVSHDLVHHGDAFYASDQKNLELISDAPFKRHVDGEPLEPASSARFAIVPGALQVRA